MNEELSAGSSDQVNSGITVDFLILADAAQVQGDKLYLLGGGWSIIWAKSFPARHQVAVAAGILVPWLETNIRHRFRIVALAEGGVVLGEVGGEFEHGRPAGLPPGATQRVMWTATMNLTFERAGDVSVEFWLGDVLAKTSPFRTVERKAR